MIVITCSERTVAWSHTFVGTFRWSRRKNKRPPRSRAELIRSADCLPDVNLFTFAPHSFSHRLAPTPWIGSTRLTTFREEDLTRVKAEDLTTRRKIPGVLQVPLKQFVDGFLGTWRSSGFLWASTYLKLEKAKVDKQGTGNQLYNHNILIGRS